jgi:cytochrome c oxidase cbb3-type subunit III
MMNRINKKWAIAALVMSASVLPAAALSPEPSMSETWLSTDNLLLAVVAFLLLPIYILSKTLFFAVKMFWEKKQSEGVTPGRGITKVLLPLAILLSAQSAFAQDAAVAAAAEPVSYTWLILMVIAVEVSVIAILGMQTIRILKMASNEVAESEAHPMAAKVQKESWIQAIWVKMNSLRPMEEEADLDTGHSYDGIRELDNITPPWFTAAFVASIIFAIIYLWVFHVSKTAPHQIEEYERVMAQAELDKQAFLATQANSVDENTVEYLAAASDLAAGKKVFDNSCAVCHKEDMGGSVGPNLVDEYWIHGGSVKDVFALIKYGAQDKGMMPWKDELTPLQIAQVSSYILSRQGETPSGARDPQGEKYVPATEEEAPQEAAEPTAQLNN